MSLVIQQSDRFTIEVNFSKDKNGILKIGEGVEKAVFVFRKPTWLDTRAMLSSAVIVSGNNGQAIIDPYKIMDLKIKTLLCDWDLAKDGKKIAVSTEVIDQLDPMLIQYLFDKINEVLSPVENETPKQKTEQEEQGK